MKTVYSSNKSLVHAWANDVSNGSALRSSSMYCEYGRLFSYSTCIAEIVNDTVIFNTSSYSNSTCKHQGYARNSIHGKNEICLDFGSRGLNTLVLGLNDFNSLVEYNEKIAADYLMKASRARLNADSYNSYATAILTSLKQYADFVELPYELRDLSALKESAIAGDKIRKAQEKANAIARKASQSEALQLWREGSTGYHYFETTALRIKGDIIQTSKGANIPVDHAVKAWPLLKKAYDSNETFYPQNHAIHFGNYTLRSVDHDNLIIGCHVIPMLEVLTIAKQLNLRGA